LRIDLDPIPGVPWEHVREVALACRDVLTDHGIEGWPKTSGSRGMHIFCRIERRWSFVDVRRAALALAREVEARCLISPLAAGGKRNGTASSSTTTRTRRTTRRPGLLGASNTGRAGVGPLRWDEVPTCEAGDFTVATMPARFAAIGMRPTHRPCRRRSEQPRPLAAEQKAAGL